MIFCDLDGTLTDFVGRCNDLLPFDFFELQAKHGPDVIWPDINKYGINFWVGMQWMPDGKKLWNYLIANYRNIRVLSGVPRYKMSRYPKLGKHTWIDNNLGIYIERELVRRGDKVKFCDGYQDILIDDYEKTVLEWRANGGTAILHTSAKSTICQLKKLKGQNEDKNGFCK